MLACVGAYRDEVRLLADMPLLARSYNRLDVGRLHETATEKSLRDEIERSVRRARQRTSTARCRASPRRADDRAAGARIVQEPPLITRLPEAEREAVAEALDAYLLTLAPHWRRAIGGYTLVDVAHKVVGVGSVGLRAYVALLEGSAPDDVVFLQLKQARRSVLAPYVHGGSAWHAHQGQRVVEYQQALQTVSDPLLGWTTVDLPGEGPLDFYVRQFRNSKGTIPLDAIDAAALTDYAGIVGHLLAKGHARTSGASMIAGYAGKGDKLGEAFAPLRPARTPTRPRPTTPCSSPPSAPGGCRRPRVRWSGWARRSGPDLRGRRGGGDRGRAAPPRRVQVVRQRTLTAVSATVAPQDRVRASAARRPPDGLPAALARSPSTVDGVGRRRAGRERLDRRPDDEVAHPGAPAGRGRRSRRTAAPASEHVDRGRRDPGS